MSALWYPQAERRPGPERKTSGTRSASVVKAAVYHDADGSYAGLLSVLDGPREASWHLSNRVEGPLVQHYALDLVTWHAKGYNTPTIGVENEGVAGTPLSLSQSDNLRDFSRWLVDEGWLPGLTRPSVTVRVADATLLEHNEVGRYIADPPYPTACPSGRITWDYILEEEDMGNQAAVNKILVDSANLQQGQIEFLITVANKLNSRLKVLEGTHASDEWPPDGLVEAVAENRRRLEALGAAASGE